MVEQNARRALAMSDRGYVLDLGKDRFEGPGKELLDDPKVAELYLGGTARIDEPDAAPSSRAAATRSGRSPKAPAASPTSSRPVGRWLPSQLPGVATATSSIGLELAVA